MASELTLGRPMLLGRVVIQDQIQVHAAGWLLFEPLQEGNKFLMAVLRHTAAIEYPGGALAWREIAALRWPAMEAKRF